MKLFTEAANNNPTEDNKEKINEYDEPASQEEISGLREEVGKKIEKKAEEIRISETEDIEIYKDKVIELAGLDMESLNPENLENLNCGSLEFIKDSIDKAISEFWRSEKTGELVTGTTSKIEGSINEAFEFVKKHKKIVSLGELTLYASSFGPAVLKDLAGNDVKVKIGDQKISLKDLVDNPELLKEIKNGHTNLPFEILNEDQRFKENFESFDIEFSLKVIEEETENGVKEKYVCFDTLKHLHILDKTADERKIFGDLEKDLNEIGISLDSQDGGCSIDSLASNMAKVVSIISENLGLREKEVENYLETFVIAETSKFSVVEITALDDIKIKESLGDSETILELEQKRKEIYDEVFNFYSGTHEEKQQKAIEEWGKWGKENGYGGYEDVERALEQERFDYENSAEKKFKEIKVKEEQQVAEFENMEEFEEIILEKLKEAGYSIDKLKEIAEDDPFEIYTIIAKIIGENVEYDWELYSKHILNIISKGKIVNDEDLSRNASELPYNAIKDGKIVCDGKALTFIAFKNVLEKNGVNLDKTAVLDTSVGTWHGKYGHVCNVLYFIDENNNITIVPFDITFLGDEDLSKIPEKINVTNKSYSYDIKEKINKVHDKALEKIKDYNILAFQEKLKQVLMQYNPKHKPEIEVDKKAFEEITKKKTRSSREDKKKDINSLP